MISTLEPNEAQLFYKLWIPFLDYVNQKYRMDLTLEEMGEALESDVQKVHAVLNFLKEHPELFDWYLNTANLPSEHYEIVANWKRFVWKDFVLERHLKKGSSFISVEDRVVYMVKGVRTRFEDMFPWVEPPFRLQAILLPFKGKIICAEVISHKKFPVFPYEARYFRGIYRCARLAGVIDKTLLDNSFYNFFD